MKLLIVPAMIAAGGLWFNSQQRTRELLIADERAQDEALQAYLDHMGQLLTDTERPLRRAQRGDNLSAVARARTLAVLQRLESLRKGTVLQFLYEAGLITRHRVVLDLRKADLSTVYLDRTDLTEVNLDGAEMQRAILFVVNLTGASMLGTNLSGASLSGVQLQGAFLGGAYLEDALLVGANLEGAYLIAADLKNAMVTEEQLEQAASLQEATMPNGQKYEEWLKDKESRGGD